MPDVKIPSLSTQISAVLLLEMIYNAIVRG